MLVEAGGMQQNAAMVAQGRAERGAYWVVGPIQLSGQAHFNGKPFFGEHAAERFISPSFPVTSIALQVSPIPISFGQPQAIAAFALLSLLLANRAPGFLRVLLFALE